MPQPPKSFVAHPFAYHQEIELEIHSLSNLGKGVGRIDNWVVFVPFCLPGDRVLARVYKNAPNFSEADLVEVLEPSPRRVPPRCRHFGSCGGCQYQHLAYEDQLEWKRRQVCELFRHMAGVEVEVDPVVPSPLTYGYRSKITPHFEAPREGRIEAIGFLKPGRRRTLVDLEECPIAMPVLEEAFQKLRDDLHDRAAEFRRGATLLLRANAGEPPVLTDPTAVATERVGDLEFRFPAGEFFQNNPFILEAFAAHVREEAAAGGARFLLDTYCGCGFFCLTGARAFEKSIGVEVSRSSIDWARRNAEGNRIGNAEFYVGKAETIFPRYPYAGPETAVIIDPPRRGCDPLFLQRLFALQPERVIYVSCNPATQIRDLRLFLEQGFTLTRVQPFDLFPQTRHLECVATLVKQTRG